MNQTIQCQSMKASRDPTGRMMAQNQADSMSESPSNPSTKPEQIRKFSVADSAYSTKFGNNSRPQMAAVQRLLGKVKPFDRWSDRLMLEW
jgi:hypothetical protein